MNTKSKIIRIVLPLIAAYIIIAVIMLLFIYVPSFNRAVVLATSVKPELFTELYFEDHLSLPEKVVLSKENNFRFTIHNLENKDMEYLYEVYIDIEGQRDTIDKNSILVKNNEFKTIDVGYTITTPLERVRVVVNLINEDQSIAFWIDY